jgi:glycosyltransferase involved in cell wall biosynthesis
VFESPQGHVCAAQGTAPRFCPHNPHALSGSVPERDPLVSVIVPAFNAAAHLGAALDSLRAQSLHEIEIIVVDDGSTDDTVKIARTHAAEDARVCVIAHEKSSGRPSIARNTGLRAARGMYIALLDADDTSVPTRLESQLRAMERTGARFAFSDMQRLYADSGSLAPAGTLATDHFLEKAHAYLERVDGNVYLCSPSFAAFLLTYIAVVTPTVIFARELLATEKVWFDESLVCFEDLDLWMRLADHTRFAYVNEVLVIVRKHSRSLTASNPIATRIDGIGVRRKHLARLAATMSQREIDAAVRNISELQFHVAYAQWCAGEGQQARRWYRDSWRSRANSGAALGFLKSFMPRESVLRGLATLRSRLTGNGDAQR